MAALAALQIDEVADSGQMRGILAEGSSECRLERGGPVSVQQLEEPSGERAQMHAPGGGKLEEPRSTRGGIM